GLVQPISCLTLWTQLARWNNLSDWRKLRLGWTIHVVAGGTPARFGRWVAADAAGALWRRSLRATGSCSHRRRGPPSSPHDEGRPQSSSLLLETHLFKRGRPGIGVDQHQRRLRHARPDTTRPDVFPERSKSHPIVERLLNLVQQSLALLPIGLTSLLLVERVDVGIPAIGIRAVTRHDLRHARGGVAVERAGADTHAAQLFGRPGREKSGPLHRAHLELDPHSPEIPHDRLAHREVRGDLMQFAGVEPVRVT